MTTSKEFRFICAVLACLIALLGETNADELKFRPPDSRPKFDDASLASLGVMRFESKRLVLYTDVNETMAREIMPLIDQSFDALEDYFGKMPPAEDGAEYQVTGYVLRDRQLFQEAGLAPKNLPPFINGRHRGQEFWVNVPGETYYLKHLVIHEATHCFMTLLPGTNSPLWYLEGMAELFGIHRVDEKGRAEFRILPQPDELDILTYSGRIKLMELDIRENGGKSFNEVVAFDTNAFMRLDNAAYVWSWGMCKFLDSHPRYRERFRELGQHRGFDDFAATMHRLFDEDAEDLQIEWIWFSHGICPGYDFERAAVDFRRGRELQAGQSASVDIAADRGWQSSAVKLVAGKTYQVTASGQFSLADKPSPWPSEPQGITFRYNQGLPLGRLIGVIHKESSIIEVENQKDEQRSEILMPIVVIGKESTFTASRTGTLYLRVNDAFSSLDNNAGTLKVTVNAIAEP
ncbi:MAG: hypothetical protein O2955_14235 [Planctomycetota bacterium]|nr:hypothetical protein [Planctomycetota bacterium]MDA1213670.1 hypothetical protein [Planctomycetota bacterium]